MHLEFNKGMKVMGNLEIVYCPKYAVNINFLSTDYFSATRGESLLSTSIHPYNLI